MFSNCKFLICCISSWLFVYLWVSTLGCLLLFLSGTVLLASLNDSNSFYTSNFFYCSSRICYYRPIRYSFSDWILSFSCSSSMHKLLFCYFNIWYSEFWSDEIGYVDWFVGTLEDCNLNLLSYLFNYFSYCSLFFTSCSDCRFLFFRLSYYFWMTTRSYVFIFISLSLFLIILALASFASCIYCCSFNFYYLAYF